MFKQANSPPDSFSRFFALDSSVATAMAQPFGSTFLASSF
jgi:hypothetical protein